VRALLDTNVLVSYLLHPLASTPPARCVRDGVAGRYVLLWPPEVGAELKEKVVTKPYLATRITPHDVDALIALVTATAELLSPLVTTVPSIGRDPDDDVFLVQADRGNADVVVTGDEDLLILRYYKGIWILSPAEFLVELEFWHKLAAVSVQA
jgi:putative PIN family toxin of toxin-antitoxin system